MEVHRSRFTPARSSASRSRKKAEAVLADNAAAVSQGSLYFCQCDSSKASDVAQLAAFVQEKIGGCDVLVNCAAIFVGGQVHEVSEEDFDSIMDIDVKGVFLTSKAFLPQMLEQACQQHPPGTAAHGR